jgi:MFS family permease
VFITPITQDMGISRTSVSSAYAFATLIAAFGLPFIGRLIDRYGVRQVFLGVALGFGLCAIGFGLVTNMAMLTVAFAALRFLGQGSLMLCSANLVSQWFARKRGFALSLMSLGFAISIAAHPYLAQKLIDAFGWREAWLWLGIMTWLLLVPIVFVLVQSRPEDLGMRPDGDPHDHGDIDAGANTDTSSTNLMHVGLTLKQAMRTPAFWIIAFGLSSLSMLATGIFFHQVSILETQGLTPQQAASVFTVTAVTMVICMPIFGRLLDRYRTQYLFSATLFLMACCLAAMSQVQGLVSALVFAAVFGLTSAAQHTQVAFVWPRFFGRAHLGSIQGSATTINVIGASLGPLPLGMAYDSFGSYNGALLALAIIPIGAAIAVFFIRAPDLAAAH